jgi:hypothetical protein
MAGGPGWVVGGGGIVPDPLAGGGSGAWAVIGPELKMIRENSKTSEIRQVAASLRIEHYLN